MASDQDLIDQSRQGDARAFEELYLRYKDWVLGLAWRITGDHDLSLDILQETFMYLLDKVPTLSLTSKLTTFLYPVVKHLALNAMAKGKRFRGTVDLGNDLVGPPAPCQDLDDLKAAMASLSDGLQEVVLMRFVHGMTLAEIASALGIPEGTVKSRLHNALEQLRHDPRCRRYFLP